MKKIRKKRKDIPLWSKYVIIFVIFIVCIAPIIYWNIIVPRELKYYGKYTIGYTTRRIIPANGGREAEYRFYVGGKEYIGVEGIGQQKVKFPNDKYYVKFSPRNPNMNWIYLDKTISSWMDTIQPPTQGWTAEELKQLDLLFNPQYFE